MSDRERWEEVPEFPDYMVSDQGHIYSIPRREERRLTMNQWGIVMVQFTRDRKQFTRSVALQVARAFVPNEEPRFDTPIHLDGNKENCSAENLAWRPRAFAIQYHRQFGSDDFHVPGSPVMDVETGEEFADTRALAIRYGLIRSHIFVAIANGLKVFPTGQEFVIINNVIKHGV